MAQVRNLSITPFQASRFLTIRWFFYRAEGFPNNIFAPRSDRLQALRVEPPCGHAPALWRGETTVNSTNWFVVRTTPRGELAALADIQAMEGLEAYLPQETRLRRTRKGKVVVHHPLLPGFLFVGTQGRSIFDALRSKSVRGIIRSPGGAAHPIRSKIVNGTAWNFVDELKSREIAGEFDFTPKHKPLVEGAEVRVISGAFKDQIGRLLSASDEGRAEIMMSGLFAGRMTVDARALEAA